MTTIKYHTTDRDRVCKLCGDKMVRHTWGIVFADVHVSPKVVDIHFHEGCLMRALDAAKAGHPTKDSTRVTHREQPPPFVISE